MAKKSVIAGEYIIEIADNGRVEVMRVPSNLYQTMRDIAKEKDFPVDEKWNTQDLGRKLVNEFGDGKEAHFGDVVVKRLPTQQIEIYEECGHGNVKPELRAISDKMGFPYDKSWNTQTFGSKLVDYLLENKEKADKVLQTKRGSRTSDTAVADPSSSVIKLTVNREKSETIELSVIATGEVTIEGVEEPMQADGKSHDYTFTADEVVIRGAVTDFICRSWPRTGMTHLDLSGCPTLTSLDCRGLLAEELDLSKLVDLTKLSIDRCQQLPSLDLSKLVNLTELSISSFDQLTSLDLSKHVNLTKLSCSYCERLTTIDLSGSKELRELYVNDCKALEVVRCHSDAVPKLYLDLDFPILKEEEGDETRLINKKLAKKKKAGSRKKPKLRQADPKDCPYELMLYSKRPIRATEIFTFDERTDEVDQIEELIKSGDKMALWEDCYGEGELFAILDLWGGDEGLYYKVTDEDKNVVSEGDLEILEDAVCDFGQIKPLITEENHPKYILIRREYRRGSTSYYKIPKDLDLEKCTFPSIRAFESFSLINLDWEGDTMTGIEYGFRCDGVEYSPFYSEFDDGDSDFALYEYDEDKGRYNEVASTI